MPAHSDHDVPRGTGQEAVAPLQGLRVIELAEHVSGPYAARLLGDLGADVVKVESPAGDPSRRHGPFPHEPDPEQSGLFHVLNYGKRGIVLDLDDAVDLGRLDLLLTTADVFLTNLPLAYRRDRGLAPAELASRHPHLVVGSVTPFGDDGPLAQAPGCALTSAAQSGASWVIGHPDRAPLTIPFDIPDYEGGANLAGAALAALLRQRLGHGGQVVDVSVTEVLASFVGTNWLMFVPYGKPWNRAGRSASESGGAYPFTILPCADGHVTLIGRSLRDWKAILAAMGSPAWADAERFADPNEIARHSAAEADAHLTAWMADKTRDELLEIARQHGFALGPVLTVDEVLAHPHLHHRGTFSEPIPVGDAFVTPPFSHFHMSTWDRPRHVRSAPPLGAHGREILAELAEVGA